jgi:hypothetical protein
MYFGAITRQDTAAMIYRELSVEVLRVAFIPSPSHADYKKIDTNSLSTLQIQIASMCMCINISATVALGCLFTPKVYIVLFQPYKNIRPGTNVSPDPHTHTQFKARTESSASVNRTNHCCLTALKNKLCTLIKVMEKLCYISS